MALNLYRRHVQACEAGHPRYVCSGEFEERKKGWKRCSCVIFASGTLSGKFRRRGTDKADWTEAKAIVAGWEAAGTWDALAALFAVLTTQPDVPTARAASTASPPPPHHTPSASAATVADACAAFIGNREAAGLAPSTLRKYQTFKKRILAFTERKGYVMIDQFTAVDIDVFWTSWKLGKRAKAKRLTTLRGFFRFCVHREWIVKSPVTADIKAPVGSSKAVNKAPFTDEELQRIFDACDRVQVNWKNETGTGVWTGEDVKDIGSLMAYTGYRISDASFFDMKHLRGNQVFLRAKKNGGDVFTYLPDWLVKRLRARAERFGTRPFLVGRSDRLETVTNVWRKRLAKVFTAAGPFDEPATPHRFRHTFARILLQKGVPVADVADLLGDDEKTVREHYGRWVPERQDRLTAILQDAFSDKPKLVED